MVHRVFLNIQHIKIIHTIALDNVLVPVDPRITSGRTYSLTREENEDDCRKFKEVMMDF